MLIGWSPHSGTAGQADGPRALSDYFDAAVVMKRLANGHMEPVRRHPAPEILLGDAALLRMAIRSSTCVHRYASCVMSFAAADIDVEAFNGGDPDARFGADQALRLWIDTALAGVPAEARPPIYFTTHTHTGALEINVAVPRWIRGPDGRQRGFNPAPPGKVNRETWDAVRDLLNHKYGWADPDDPANRRAVVLPNWMLKLEAESRRAGMASPTDARRKLLDDIGAAVEAGGIRDRADVLGWLDKHSGQSGFVVHGVTSKSVTIGPVGAVPRDRMRLKGTLFEESFGQHRGPVVAHELETARRERARVLATAGDRLQLLWDRRAAFNRSRYGLDQWPEPPWSAAQYQNARPGDAPLAIPSKHHLYLLSKGPHPHDTKADHDGARLARYGGPNEHRSTGTRCGAERKDQRFDTAIAAARSFRCRFAQVAEALHAEGLVAHLSARIKRLAFAIRSRMTLKRVSAALPDTLLRTLADTRSALEEYNETDAINIDPSHADRTEAGGVDPTDHAIARPAGGQPRRNGGPARGGDRRLGADRVRAAENGESAERGKGEAVPSAGRQAEHPHEKTGGADAVAARSPRLVGSTPAPETRAGLLRFLRDAVYEVDASAQVGLQFTNEHDRWPPRLEINMKTPIDRGAGQAVSSKAVVTLTCAPSLIVEIAPVLKRAVEAKWIDGVEFNPANLEGLPTNKMQMLKMLHSSATFHLQEPAPRKTTLHIGDAPTERHDYNVDEDPTPEFG